MATILVVEDDADLRFLYAAALERHGHAVISVPETIPALLQLTNRAIDAIVLDIALPDLPGTRLLEFVRDDPRLRDIPVLVISGNGRVREHALALGAYDFCVKPVTMRDLVALIDRIAGSRPPGDQA